MSVPQTISLPGASHQLPFSPALVWANLVFVSGQVGKDPITDTFEEDIAAQTRQTLSNIKALVEAAGTTLDKTLRMTIYMTDMHHEFAAMNAVFKEFFTKALPARSCVGISHLAKPGLKIEIDLVGYKD